MANTSRLTGPGEARCSYISQAVRMTESIRSLCVNLAETFLRGPWEVSELAARAKSALITSRRLTWVTWLARRVFAAFPGPSPPRLFVLIRFLECDESLRRTWYNCIAEGFPTPEFDLDRMPKPTMQPASGNASSWGVPSLVTPGEVADWFGITTGELDWFADCQFREARSREGPLRHYRYRWIPKPSGGQRLLEIPKPRLKAIQRQILDQILSRIPAHSSAHAFRCGRSIASYLEPHANQQIVLHIDLREFFPSVRASQVYGIFRSAGYPEKVASILTGLCTNKTPSSVLQTSVAIDQSDRRWKNYHLPHLPQGSPSSPALANLAAFWLDCRLSGLARKLNISYTRYADDLLFSGGIELARCVTRFRVLVTAIVHHEGFEIRRRKTHEMRSGSRQQVSGIILNRRLNIPRHEYDLLRAILHNCHHQGPESQNLEKHPHFREHLSGRIGYWSTICPDRARKLRTLFDQIVWD